jgi:hypothetical protein
VGALGGVREVHGRGGVGVARQDGAFVLTALEGRKASATKR